MTTSTPDQRIREVRFDLSRVYELLADIIDIGDLDEPISFLCHAASELANIQTDWEDDQNP